MVTREEASKFQALVDKTFCIWCGENAPPVSPNKKYCAECDRYCLRECKHCHKPYDNLKFFEGDSTSVKDAQEGALIFYYYSSVAYTLTSGQVCGKWVIEMLLRFTYSSGHSSFSETVMLSRKQP